MLKRVLLAILVVIGFLPVAQATDQLNLAAFDRLEGFIDLYWDADTGRILIDVEEIDEPFIYQSSLSRGVGSNDLGLDRGQHT